MVEWPRNDLEGRKKPPTFDFRFDISTSHTHGDELGLTSYVSGSPEEVSQSSMTSDLSEYQRNHMIIIESSLTQTTYTPKSV